jgi:hypothetical protein
MNEFVEIVVLFKEFLVKDADMFVNMFTYSVQSHQRILGQHVVVGDLIDQRHGVCKGKLLHEVLMLEEAQVIENIPLSPCLPPDRLIWKETQDGNFTVRSAYHLEKKNAQIF